MEKSVVRIEKHKDLLERICLCIENGHYKFSNHALERKQQRGFTLPDIHYILKNGYHEKVKDVWNEQHHIWNYSIRGKTLDKNEGRIIVSLDNLGMLIITVIRLTRD